jgi:hypothetical protein
MKRALLALAMLASAAVPAGAVDFYVQNWQPIGLPFADDGAVPACNSAGVLSGIRSRFAWAHSRTWRTGLSISAIDQAGDTRAGGEYPSLIGRRYCQASAVISDGARSSVFYLIETHQGFAGLGARVTFCLPGYDPWHVYDKDCRTVRPL